MCPKGEHHHTINPNDFPALHQLPGILTELAAHLRGQSANGVLFSGQLIFPANGVLELPSFTVPTAAVAVANLGNGEVTVTTDTKQSSAPTSGPGVMVVRGNSGRCWGLVGHQLTLYGTTGERVDLCVYSVPTAPAFGTV